MNLPRRVAIIGTGLVGGSLGMVLRRAWPGVEVIGAARHAATAARAVERGAIDRAAATAAEAVEGADLVVVATPVGAIPDVLREIGPALGAGAVVTDVGSTKAGIVAAAEAILPPSIRFVGAHPMAGSEREGIEAADRRLFDGAVVVVTPSARSGDGVSTVRSMWQAAGAIVLEMPPAEHDRAVAAVSHLPHLVAAALVAAVADVAAAADDEGRVLALAAGGFRDTTRIASAPPALWRGIVLENRAAIADVLATFRRRLDEIESALGDGDRLEAALEAARAARARVPAVARGALPAAFDISVEVEDRPGALAEVTAILAAAEANIRDVEVLRAREGGAGPIRLSLASEAERQRALGALAARGFRARSG